MRGKALTSIRIDELPIINADESNANFAGVETLRPFLEPFLFCVIFHVDVFSSAKSVCDKSILLTRRTYDADRTLDVNECNSSDQSVLVQTIVLVCRTQQFFMNS